MTRLPAVAGLLLATLAAPALSQDPFVGMYFLVDAEGPQKLAALAKSANNLPFNRLIVSFFSPSLVYAPGSNTLKDVGLGLSNTGDYGFGLLKSSIASLKAGGVETFLSIVRTRFSWRFPAAIQVSWCKRMLAVENHALLGLCWW